MTHYDRNHRPIGNSGTADMCQSHGLLVRQISIYPTNKKFANKHVFQIGFSVTNGPAIKP